MSKRLQRKNVKKVKQMKQTAKHKKQVSRQSNTHKSTVVAQQNQNIQDQNIQQLPMEQNQQQQIPLEELRVGMHPHHKKIYVVAAVFILFLVIALTYMSLSNGRNLAGKAIGDGCTTDAMCDAANNEFCDLTQPSGTFAGSCVSCLDKKYLSVMDKADNCDGKNIMLTEISTQSSPNCVGKTTSVLSTTCQYTCDSSMPMVHPKYCTDGVVGNYCTADEECTTDNQCVDQKCQAKVAEPTCSDGIKNQDESDVDCGGSCGAICANDKVCVVNTDCQSNNCDSGVCKEIQIPQVCTDPDEISNTLEQSLLIKSTTVDSTHGSFTDKCYQNQVNEIRCINGVIAVSGYYDCPTGYYCPNNDVGACVAKPVDAPISAAESCKDGIKNQDETDVDCGGVCGAICANDKVCLVNTDCQSNNCVGGVCKAITQPQSQDCVDTDGGKNYAVKGVASKGTDSKEDWCNPANGLLLESWCENNEVKYQAGNQCYDLAGKTTFCQDGACIPCTEKEKQLSCDLDWQTLVTTTVFNEKGDVAGDCNDKKESQTCSNGCDPIALKCNDAPAPKQCTQSQQNYCKEEINPLQPKYLMQKIVKTDCTEQITEIAACQYGCTGDACNTGQVGGICSDNIECDASQNLVCIQGTCQIKQENPQQPAPQPQSDLSSVLCEESSICEQSPSDATIFALKKIICSDAGVQTEQYVPCESGCVVGESKCTVASAPEKLLCVDTDITDNPFVSGIVTNKFNVQAPDSCSGVYLTKASCDDFGAIKQEQSISCANGCDSMNNVCMQTVAQTKCTDPDKFDITVKGTTTDATGAHQDSCNANGQVLEYSCSGNIAKQLSIDCPIGQTCSDGACSCPAGNVYNENIQNCEQPTCVDTAGETPFTRDSITSNFGKTGDICGIGNSLKEAICIGSKPDFKDITCANGCKDGACILPLQACMDYDATFLPNSQAENNVFSELSLKTKSYAEVNGVKTEDKCQSEGSPILNEQFCNDANTVSTTVTNCQDKFGVGYSCFDGLCVQCHDLNVLGTLCSENRVMQRTQTDYCGFKDVNIQDCGLEGKACSMGACVEKNLAADNGCVDTGDCQANQKCENQICTDKCTTNQIYNSATDSCVTKSCVDSDAESTSTKSIVTDATGSYSDLCFNSGVLEYICVNNEKATKVIACPTGTSCKNNEGVCTADKVADQSLLSADFTYMIKSASDDFGTDQLLFTLTAQQQNAVYEWTNVYGEKATSKEYSFSVTKPTKDDTLESTPQSNYQVTLQVIQNGKIETKTKQIIWQCFTNVDCTAAESCHAETYQCVNKCGGGVGCEAGESCQNSVCVANPVINTTVAANLCVDPDSTLPLDEVAIDSSAYKKSSVTGKNMTTNKIETKSDYCTADAHLAEGYCINNDYYNSKLVTCPAGKVCNDGACVANVCPLQTSITGKQMLCISQVLTSLKISNPTVSAAIDTDCTVQKMKEENNLLNTCTDGQVYSESYQCVVAKISDDSIKTKLANCLTANICVDSNPDNNMFKSGVVIDKDNKQFNDSCINGKSTGYACDANGNAKVLAGQNCPDICWPEGATAEILTYCKAPSQSTTDSVVCEDSDGGDFPLEKGAVVIGDVKTPDSCDGNKVKEYVCTDEGILDSNTNYDCASVGKVCQDGACVAKEQVGGSNACITNSQCAADQLCFNSVCVAKTDIGKIACTVDNRDTVCPLTYTCNLVTGFCAQPSVCSEDGSCANGQKCVSNKCVDKCTADTDCSTDYTCDLATAVCVVKIVPNVCSDANPCAVGYVCDATTKQCVVSNNNPPQGTEVGKCVDGDKTYVPFATGHEDSYNENSIFIKSSIAGISLADKTEKSESDYCTADGQLAEGVCTDKDNYNFKLVDCPAGKVCQNGACVVKANVLPQTLLCKDTDAANSVTVKGEVSFFDATGNSGGGDDDGCADPQTVNEATCSDEGLLVFQKLSCPTGTSCKNNDGVCTAVAKECSADVDCKDGKICNAIGSCVLKSISCTANNDCKEGTVCDQTVGSATVGSCIVQQIPPDAGGECSHTNLCADGKECVLINNKGNCLAGGVVTSCDGAKLITKEKSTDKVVLETLCPETCAADKGCVCAAGNAYNKLTNKCDIAKPAEDANIPSGSVYVQQEMKDGKQVYQIFVNVTDADGIQSLHYNSVNGDVKNDVVLDVSSLKCTDDKTHCEGSFVVVDPLFNICAAKNTCSQESISVKLVDNKMFTTTVLLSKENNYYYESELWGKAASKQPTVTLLPLLCDCGAVKNCQTDTTICTAEQFCNAQFTCETLNKPVSGSVYISPNINLDTTKEYDLLLADVTDADGIVSIMVTSSNAKEASYTQQCASKTNCKLTLEEGVQLDQNVCSLENTCSSDVLTITVTDAKLAQTKITLDKSNNYYFNSADWADASKKIEAPAELKDSLCSCPVAAPKTDSKPSDSNTPGTGGNGPSGGKSNTCIAKYDDVKCQTELDKQACQFGLKKYSCPSTNTCTTSKQLQKVCSIISVPELVNTCFNKKFDAGETSIDCGGKCKSCDASVNKPYNAITSGKSTVKENLAVDNGDAQQIGDQTGTETTQENLQGESGNQSELIDNGDKSPVKKSSNALWYAIAIIIIAVLIGLFIMKKRKDGVGPVDGVEQVEQSSPLIQQKQGADKTAEVQRKESLPPLEAPMKLNVQQSSNLRQSLEESESVQMQQQTAEKRVQEPLQSPVQVQQVQNNQPQMSAAEQAKFEKLKQYVQMELQKGFSPADVQAKLLSVGWNKELVEHVMGNLK